MYDNKLDQGDSDSDSDSDSEWSPDCSDDECGPYCNCEGSSGYDMEDLINMYMFDMFGGRGFRYW